MWKATSVLACSSRAQRHSPTIVKGIVASQLILQQPPSLLHLWQRSHGTHHHHQRHCHPDNVLGQSAESEKGARITVIGMAANVGLTVTKGVAGYVMNSASLLADAAHSLSDLLSDFVTLYTYKVSRKPPDSLYPYGYGKYETIGSIAVSTLLITGALGIGYHSLDLLQSGLQAAAQDAVTHATVTDTTSAFSMIPSMLHLDHSHGSGVLDPNAAWVALASIGIKEWLFQATLRIGKSEKSEVLIANAWHHRADSLSSGVAMVAILGSYAGIPALDPLGGLAVAGLILKGTTGILTSSLGELMDRGMKPSEMSPVLASLANAVAKETDRVHLHSVRGRKLGPFYHIDFALQVDPHLDVHRVQRLQQRLQASLRHDCEQVQEIHIRLQVAPVQSSNVQN